MFKMKPREDEVPSSPRGAVGAPKPAAPPTSPRSNPPGSREESAPLIGRQQSSKKGRKGAKPSDGAEDDSGCWNDCLRSHCGLRNRKMRNRCYLLLAILVLILAALGGIGYLIDQAITSSSSSSSSDDSDDDSHHHHHHGSSTDDADDASSAETNGSANLDVDDSDDGKRDTDKASHGADFLPTGGKHTDDQADVGFGARKLRVGAPRRWRW